ncbi:MAG: hypothetical protein ABI402_00145 [Ferruginibacter sp.]
MQNKGLLEYPIKTNIQPNYYNPLRSILDETPTQSVTFISDSCVKVSCIFDGEVCLIEEIDSMYVVMTKFGSYYLTYTNLTKPVIKKGDFIKKGQIIANLDKDFDDRFSVDIYLNYGEKTIDAYSWFRKKIISKNSVIKQTENNELYSFIEILNNRL